MFRALDIADELGAVIVTTNGRPLPIDVRAFEDADEARSFIAWMGEQLHSERYDSLALATRVKEWRLMRGSEAAE